MPPAVLRSTLLLCLASLGAACAAAGAGQGRARSDLGDAGADGATRPWTPPDAGPRPDTGPRPDAGPAPGCTQVDLLFVVDNSPSMRPHQEALAAAFPSFVDAMYDRLPPAVSLHVGVTTTSFYSGSCGESVINCVTSASDEEVRAHYVAPTDGSTGTNGEQGRLFEHAGRPFFEANTSDLDRGPLTEWFAGAAVAAGEGGCSFEMSSAAAGYAVHPANAATNAGFVRDDDAVLVVFVLSDEPDKSPEGAGAYRDMLVGAKSACGGEACIMTAGLVNPCIRDVDNTLWQLLGAFGEAPVWGDIDDTDGYGDVVGDALARVVEQRCNEVVLY